MEKEQSRTEQNKEYIVELMKSQWIHFIFYIKVCYLQLIIWLSIFNIMYYHCLMLDDNQMWYHSRTPIDWRWYKVCNSTNYRDSRKVIMSTNIIFIKFQEGFLSKSFKVYFVNWLLRTLLDLSISTRNQGNKVNKQGSVEVWNFLG